MSEDEQKFWDAAFVAIVGGNEAADENNIRTIESCATLADVMLEERRKRMAKNGSEK